MTNSFIIALTHSLQLSCPKDSNNKGSSFSGPGLWRLVQGFGLFCFKIQKREEKGGEKR